MIFAKAFQCSCHYCGKRYGLDEMHGFYKNVVVTLIVIVKAKMHSKVVIFFSVECRLGRVNRVTGTRVGAVYIAQGVESNRWGRRCSLSDA